MTESCVETLKRYKQFVADIQNSSTNGLKELLTTVRNFINGQKNASRFNIQVGAKLTSSINSLVHIGILFTALMVLWVTYISHVEQQTLENEFIKEIQSGVTQALKNNNIPTDLKPLVPFLEDIQPLFDGDDQARKNFNQTLVLLGFGIASLLFVVAAVLVFVMLWSGVAVWKSVAIILLENFILFAIVGVIEYFFFTLVTKKYVPVLPSAIVKEIIQQIRNGFSDCSQN